MAMARKEGRELIMSYFDVQKAYDRACMKDMLYVLHENGFRGKIWRLTRALNVNLTARIKTKAGLTREIVREKWVVNRGAGVWSLCLPKQWTR